jgi:beta-lactamase class A
MLKGMKQYTSAEMAQKTGLAERTIRKAAEANEGIGHKIGRDWVFTDADIAKIKAIVGKPRKRAAQADQPAQEPTA